MVFSIPHFSYAVTRPYPFRFFTLSVVIFFSTATILLSLFNTIVTGYDLRVSYSTNPNETMAEKMWYDKPVFGGIKKLSPSCEPKEIGVQQRFNTNQNGFIYSLRNIREPKNASDAPSPSMLYQNNPLEGCEINYIKIEMMKHIGRTAQQVAWQRWAPDLLAAISCSVTNGRGSMRFNVTTEYNLVPPNAKKMWGETQRDRWEWAAEENKFQFVFSNNTANAAMWWAESLMSYAWLDAASQMEKADDGWQSGSINFFPSGNTTDISSPSFFNNLWYILKDNYQIFWGEVYGSDISLTPKSPVDAMWQSADTLAKAFYSAISADLGIVGGSNVLTNETTLEAFTKDYSSVEFNLVSAGPASASYDALKHRTGKPEITQSTIFTTYLCQTPVRKLATSLVVSVLLANLVLLRGLWTLVTLTAGYFVEARDPKGWLLTGRYLASDLLWLTVYSKSLYAMSRVRVCRVDR
ncbi:hypothetical protein T440DRAFT_385704 [Plenodomus tracheiphilus IPT5]|uniref:Uncharacterized protein n=1 Tax=Plenodomus tracheiphilus IPT5 TaxID=1408161 RepID=A0A6A7BKZ2_9PLEO|nr:hypothetical protein T440DRAFT_385704 [Plenodomus tracheiphilus IPT5]